MLRLKVKTGGQVIMVPVEDIIPASYSSRIYMPSDEIEILAESIKENGLLQPLLIRGAEDGLYQLISGERRRRAAVLAGITYLPCLLINCNEDRARIINFNDNLHRRELHYLEFAELADELGNYMALEDIAKELNIPEGLILSRIRLLQLPQNIKWKIMSSGISESTANALCKISDENRQNAIVDMMIKAGIGFNEAYELTNAEGKKTVFVARYKDYTVFENTIEHAVDTMSASGIKVKIDKAENNMKIVYNISIDKMI